ncbi:MAG: hypothetical protein WC511_02100 [Candidatus Pacearchaeota archaeon]
MEQIQIWFAKIKDSHEDYSRKIKLHAISPKNAIKQAQAFCCPGEVLEWVTDSSGKFIFERI